MVRTRQDTAAHNQPATKQANLLRTFEARTALTVARSAKTIGKEKFSARAKEAGKVRLLKRDNERQLEAKSRAALSAKRKQAAASRWNKSAVKEDQRTKAVDKTSNHTRKLLTGDGPQKITDVIFDYPSCTGYRTLLTLLGKMQAMAKGSFLSGAEIAKFKMWSEEYFETMMTCFPQMPVTPKCHILCQHVSEFMDKHRFWGLLCEQSIEALHCKVNGDERRLSCMRERMKTLKKILKDSFVRNILFDVKVFDL